MSLLLEALKKAEKAKEEAQRRARDGDGAELQLADAAAAPAEPKHVVTRDELPQINASPLEILSEDIRAEAPKPAARELSLQDARPAAAPAPRAGGADPQATQRATARTVFEAKVREPNPRLPFYITMGALGAFAVGTVVYFWIQLRPPAPLVNTNPVTPVAEAPAAVPPAPVAQAPQSTPSQVAIQGLPTGKPPAPPAAAAPRTTPAASQPARSATPAIPRDAPPQRLKPQAAAPRAPEAPVVAARAPVLQVHPRVEAGYAAFQANRLDEARSEYQQALRDEPANRDALLGLAAVEMRAQRFEAADALYQRRLQADPRDAHAHAGMMALRGQQLDPVAAESRLKSLLAADPESGVLHFALGNQYAQRGLWADARQAYARAAASDGENADYAYNLAVSLEHLRQGALALEQYRRAVSLAARRSASFDPAAAQARIQQLAR
jgi:tetratricopeptide (TPR) repeat protein